MHRVIAISEKTAYAWYFYTYWLTYVAGAVVVFLVIQEMFKLSMDTPLAENVTVVPVPEAMIVG